MGCRLQVAGWRRRSAHMKSLICCLSSVISFELWARMSMGSRMEYRQLGQSGLRVSVLSLGTMTFGGETFFNKVGATDVKGAHRQVDLCLEAGVNLFDTANIYSHGLSEEILGQVLEGRRDQVLIATKFRMVMRDGPNDGGASRYHIIREC